jgi:hypothetical protein
MRRAMRGAGICDGGVCPALGGGPSDSILVLRLSEWPLWSVGSSPARGYAPGNACLHSFGVRLMRAGGLAIRARNNASRKWGIPGPSFAEIAWFLESNDSFHPYGHEANSPPLLASLGGAFPEMRARAAAMEGGTQARASVGAPRRRVMAGTRGRGDDLGSARSRFSRASVFQGSGSGALRIRKLSDLGGKPVSSRRRGKRTALSSAMESAAPAENNSSREVASDPGRSAR